MDCVVDKISRWWINFVLCPLKIMFCKDIMLTRKITYSNVCVHILIFKRGHVVGTFPFLGQNCAEIKTLYKCTFCFT